MFLEIVKTKTEPKQSRNIMRQLVLQGRKPILHLQFRMGENQLYVSIEQMNYARNIRSVFS